MGNIHGKEGGPPVDNFPGQCGGPTTTLGGPTDTKFSNSKARRLYAHLKHKHSNTDPEYVHDRILLFSYEEVAQTEGAKGTSAVSSTEEDGYLDCLHNASKFLNENHPDATLLINLSTDVFMNPGWCS